LLSADPNAIINKLETKKGEGGGREDRKRELSEKEEPIN